MAFPAVAAGISSILKGITGLFGGGKKKTKAALADLQNKVNVLAQENEKQSKLILYLGVGLVAVVGIVVFIVVLKKRRR